MNGIPNIAGLVTAIQTTAVSFGGAALLNAVFGKTWGIVNQFGIPILLADNVLGLAHDNSATISSLPVEGGSFASYNKVDNPSNATVQMTKSSGGTLQRGLFLTQLDTLKKSTLSFHIITPEYVYTSYQITGINLAREASSGCSLLTVNVELQEMREVKVDYSYEEVKNPEDAKTKEGGAKQPQKQTSILKDIFG
jgi:hypothetical protein